MDVIVMLKQVPDPKQYVNIKEDGTLDREHTRAVINPCDKYVLEAALRVKEQNGARITVISMGPTKAEDALREALAMGADSGVLLSDRKLAGSDTLATSYALHKMIAKLGHFDLVLCGMETSDGGTGQVGPEVAEYLGISQLTYVEEFEVHNNIIEARRMLEGGYEKLRLRLPALLTITSAVYKPRETTIFGIMRSLKQTIQKLTAADIEAEDDRIGLVGSPTKLKNIVKVTKQRKGYMVKGETPEIIVNDLISKMKEDGITVFS